MDIKEIIKTYGVYADYYDFNTGRIYAITKAKYDSETDETTIPIIKDDAYIGNVIIDGRIEEE